MTFISERATRSNKRQRIKHGTSLGHQTSSPPTLRTTQDTVTAPTIPDPNQRVGTKLEPAIEDHASHPSSLQTHVISKALMMLKFVANTKQRKESHIHFTKPVISPITNKEKDKGEGNPIKFVPNSARTKCLINSSATYKDDPCMTKSEKANEISNNLRIVQVTFNAKKRSELEIVLRIEDLKGLLFDLVFDVAKCWYIYLTRRGRFPPGSLLKEYAAHTAAESAISCAPKQWAIRFGLKEDVYMKTVDASDQNRVDKEKSQTTTASIFLGNYVRVK